MSDSLLDLGAAFRRHLLAERKAEKTAKLYLQAVRAFVAHVVATGEVETEDDVELAHLDHRRLIAYFQALNDRLAPNTVLQRWQGINIFAKWLIAEGEITTNPIQGIARPQQRQGPVPMFTDEDLTALIKACQGKRFYDRRDEAIIRMLLDCGVRVSELCGDRFLIADLDLDNGAALVTGKGSKKRMIYFGTRTARALDRYLRMRAKHRWAHVATVFIGERGAMTPDGIREITKERARKAGITGRHNPHKFRHTWADDFLANGGQERDLKRLAGWSSDAMLEVYGRSGADRRAAAAARQLRRGDRV